MRPTADEAPISRKLLAMAALLLGAAASISVGLQFGPVPTPKRRPPGGSPCAERGDEPPAPRRFPNAPGIGWLAFPGGDILVATPGTDIVALESIPCRMVVRLTRGAVLVEARDLGGGALVMTTPHGEITAHDSLFSARVDDLRLRVAVVHGRVSVRRKGESPVLLAPREAADTLGKHLKLARAPDDELARLRLTFSPDVAGPVALRADASPVPAAAFDRAPPPLAAVPPSSLPQSPAARPAPTALPPTQPPLPHATSADREAAATPEQAADLLLDAEQALRRGRTDEARVLYRRVGRSRSATASSAWLRLCRIEIDTARLADARAALNEASQRPQLGALAPEAAWLTADLARREGQTETARKVATSIVRRWPHSAQAASARTFLATPGSAK